MSPERVVMWALAAIVVVFLLWFLVQLLNRA